MAKYTIPRTDGSTGCQKLPPLRGGKKFYLAPEIMAAAMDQCNGIITKSTPIYDGALADTWSLGIVLFIMITGSPPVDRARSDCPRYRMVLTGQILDMLKGWRNDVPTLTSAACDLITRILIPEPACMRLRLDEILEHPWVRFYFVQLLNNLSRDLH